jgi:superfamily II RNA helicase
MTQSKKKETKASMPQSKKKRPSNKISLTNNWIKMSDTDLRKSIISDCLPCYPKNEPPKIVQVDAVMSLVRQRHTFVMAGTGCGKSRISEMYHHLFARLKKAVILVLNPLDALGDKWLIFEIGMVKRG